MSRWRTNRLNILSRQMVIILALVIITSADPASLLSGLRLKLGWSTTTALAQDDVLEALRDEYAQLEREGLKENFKRQLSYQMLLPYLPPGTRMTSGYRSPEKQLEVIRSFAKRLGIPTSSHMDVNDESTWRSALMALRARGFIIAAPTTTPHATSESVFDLAGAELSAIENGLRQAEKAGMVTFRKIIREPRNGAVHVEIETFSPKALDLLAKRRSPAQRSAPSLKGPSSPPTSEEDQRRGMLQQLQDLHDIEPDPAKKIDYDRARRNLLDPTIDSKRIKALADEVKQHQRQAQELAKESQKREAIGKISVLLREERYEEAEREAEKFVERFPKLVEAQDVLAEIRTRRLVTEAIAALDRSGCSECYDADRLINMALELSPDHSGAKILREEVDACLERCEPKRILIIILSLFISAGAIIGAYFLWKWILERPQDQHEWVLEGIEGPCKGQIFALDKEELTIGAQGPPNGTADIVIRDTQRKISRRHCSIMQDGKQFYLLDESTNGTKINDQDVQKGAWAEFRAGDRISLTDETVLLLRPK